MVPAGHLFWTCNIPNQKTMKPILLIIFIGNSFYGFCQQDPIYAQYLNNPLAINPAYAGSNDMLNANLQYRTQWAGIDANPITVNFNSHMSLVQNRVGAGIQVVQDKIGETKNTEFNAVYAYKLQLKDAALSFGMQTGFIRYTSNPSKLNIRDAGDEAFTTYTETKFNTGAGLLLKSDRYMIGLSVPRLLPATVSQGGQTIELYSRNFYLFGAYEFFLGDRLRFKPSALLRATKGTAPSVDLNTSFTLREYYTAGILTRNFKTCGLLVQALIKNIRLGYVYELPISSKSSLNFTSHEISFGLAMGVLTYHTKTPKSF